MYVLRLKHASSRMILFVNKIVIKSKREPADNIWISVGHYRVDFSLLQANAQQFNFSKSPSWPFCMSEIYQNVAYLHVWVTNESTMFYFD